MDGGQLVIALAQLVVSARSGTPVPDAGDLAAFVAAVTPERIGWLRTQVERTVAGSESSELYELWAETPELDAWLAQTRQLAAALG